MRSCLFVQGGRDRGAVKGVLQDYLITDEVVASTAQTMEDTLRFLDTRYGGIKRYLKVIGITKSEVGSMPSCVCNFWRDNTQRQGCVRACRNHTGASCVPSQAPCLGAYTESKI